MAVERRAEADWPHWPGRSEGTQRRERLEQRLFSATDDTLVREPEPAPGTHLLFVATPQGYALIDGVGELPAAGESLALDGAEYLVAKIGRSPLPGDDRRCAFLERFRRPTR